MSEKVRDLSTVEISILAEQAERVKAAQQALADEQRVLVKMAGLLLNGAENLQVNLDKGCVETKC